jgi:hypothetical protein
MDTEDRGEDLKQALSPVQESNICRIGNCLRVLAKLSTFNRMGFSGLIRWLA